MIKIGLLEDNDIIKANDYTRQLDFLQEGWSDQLLTNANYSGQPINRLGWIRADIVCPFWVGKTVKSFNTASTIRYEFIRGNVPDEHKEKF